MPLLVYLSVALFSGLFAVITWFLATGFRWLIIAALIMVYGAFPDLNDMLGEFVGISYPPIIPVLLGLGAILIKLLIGDIERVKTRVDIERMVQRMAMLEAELAQVKAQVETPAQQSSDDQVTTINSGRR